MAYVGNQLSVITDSIENVFNVAVLIGTDPIEDVLVANYISDGQKRGLVAGGIVYYFNGSVTYECFVSALQAPPGFGVTLVESSGGSSGTPTQIFGTGIAANAQIGSTPMPANAFITGVTLRETAGKAVTVSLGSTLGASDIMPAVAVPASQGVAVPLSALSAAWFSASLGQNVYATSGNWNGASINVAVSYQVGP